MAKAGSCHTVITPTTARSSSQAGSSYLLLMAWGRTHEFAQRSISCYCDGPAWAWVSAIMVGGWYLELGGGVGPEAEGRLHALDEARPHLITAKQWDRNDLMSAGCGHSVQPGCRCSFYCLVCDRPTPS